MVIHGFRNQQNAPAKNYNCNAKRRTLFADKALNINAIHNLKAIQLLGPNVAPNLPFYYR